eukprot:537427-Pelagomonas_calceolata.AAC.1
MVQVVHVLLEPWTVLITTWGCRGYKGKRPQSRHLTASLFMNAHEIKFSRFTMSYNELQWDLTFSQ